MHYAEFKQDDPALLKTLIETFPFATIAINGPSHPVMAQAPLTFRDMGDPAGTVDFHLARANIITNGISDGTHATILVNGPSAHISPSWYTGRFKDASADRSRTAPTWNYVSATLTGRLQILQRRELETQIADLVRHYEPADGWRFEELDPALLVSWCDMLIGCRMVIDTFDLTAKLSQNQTAADRPGIAQGLRRRSGHGDDAMAKLVEGLDGKNGSIGDILHAVSGHHCDPEP